MITLGIGSSRLGGGLQSTECSGDLRREDPWRGMAARGCGVLPGLRRSRPEFSVSRSSATAFWDATWWTSVPRCVPNAAGPDIRGGRCTPAATPSGSASRRHGPPVTAALSLPSRDLPGGSTRSMSEPRTTRTVDAEVAACRNRHEGRCPLLRVFVGSSRVREDFPHCHPRRRLTRFEHSRRARKRSLLSALDIVSQMRDAAFGRQSETSTSLRHASGYIFKLRSMSSANQSVSIVQPSFLAYRTVGWFSPGSGSRKYLRCARTCQNSRSGRAKGSSLDGFGSHAVRNPWCSSRPW